MLKKLSILAVLICAVFALPAVASAATGTITGTVTEFSGGAAVPEAEVCAEEQGGEFTRRCVLTRSDGGYTLAELASGNYSVEFTHGQSGLNLRKQYYEDREGAEAPVDVTVTSGLPVAGIDGHLKPGGELEGRVTAAVGAAAVPGVQVCAITENEYEECVETDGEGEYAFIGLSEVDYEVGFFAENFGYEAQYYDEVPGFTEATPVPVEVGSSVPGIDAALQRGGEISGHVYAAADGRPLFGIEVCAFAASSGSEPTSCGSTEPDGSYFLAVLPAGSYKVGFSLESDEFIPEGEPEPDGWQTMFWNQQPTLAAATVITLAHGGEAPGVDARLSPPVVVPPPFGSPVTITAPTQEPAPVGAPAPTRHRKPLLCRRGFRKQKHAGKVRCVRVHHGKEHGHSRLHRHGS